MRGGKGEVSFVVLHEGGEGGALPVVVASVSSSSRHTKSSKISVLTWIGNKNG